MKGPSDSLTTERLTVRRFTLDDLEMLIDLNSDPEVTRYTGGVKDRAASEKMLHDRILDYYDKHPGLGCWVTIERATGETVGMHLLNHIHGEPDIQTGYILFRKFWGRGYATEMCVEVLRYGFMTLGLPQIVAITDLPNTPSQHVLLKSGLRRKGERKLAHPHYAASEGFAWFEVDAADWLAERARGA